MILSSYFKKALFTFSLLTLLGLIWIRHQNLKGYVGEFSQDPKVFYIPKAASIKPFLLGHEGVLADLVWIRTLGYFADELLSGGKSKYLDDLINFATDLDPRFEKLYIWAGAVTMYSSGSITKEKIHASTRILEKGWKFIQSDAQGWKHAEDYWLIPQMIGFNYAIELGDRKKGAPYILAAAQIPGSPEIYKTWAASLYKKEGDVESAAKVLETMLAVEVLKGQLDYVESEDMRQKIKLRLALYYEKLYGPEQAKVRAEALINNVIRMRKVWLENFPYLSFDLFVLIWNEPLES